ncbi:hypothetical protein SARC_11084 [Sphaeroforma arctica JP610]|uniref:Major facilitator superfamily (MFS) profile domain-containing protein n=1 Tax=Sphaeroforma arctica JP610 TaxID=667725 RepID=A0A0L0FI29_9EUKA|nr:hypothetical protein SARC_11084 [Sphaeroforma arctica JP610]KNC76415.1 hypothetical protein SARC_11084 [Sphaeroforma arctica JP610]|eukprot:XP_014150317.1 hypothetical protein SARC_11084 [Sphaeroforma arctica JP610]
MFSADGLFGEFAYLLPCLVAACFSACLWVYSYFYLEETVTDLPDHPVRTYLRSIFCGRSTRETSTGTESQPLIGNHPTDTDRHFTAEDLLEKRDRRDSLSLMAAEGIHDYEIEHTHVDTILQTEADTHTNSSTAQRPSIAEPSMTLTQAIFRPQILLILFIAFLFGFVQTASNELFPLWSMMPMSIGGLAFTTDQISLCVTTMGIGLLIYTSIFFPTICRHLGVIQMYQLGVLLSAVVMAVVPFFHGIRTHVVSDAWFWTLLLSVFVGRAVAMPSCFASLTIMLQNSTTQHVGALSGVFSSVIALSQSLAPILGGSVFAYMSSGGFAFPFDYHFMFLMCGVLCIVGFVTSFKLSQSVTSRAIVTTR